MSSEDPKTALADALRRIAATVESGKFGEVSGCTVLLSGGESSAVLSFPAESTHTAIDRFAAAIQWLKEPDTIH